MVDAEFFEENRGLTDDGGVEAGSEGGNDEPDDAEPPRSLRTPFMAASSDAATDVGCGREGRWMRKLTTESLQLDLTLAHFILFRDPHAQASSMSFTFNWPRFSDQFHYDAIQMLNTALNKGNKPPIIADKIEVVELEMGTQVRAHAVVFGLGLTSHSLQSWKFVISGTSRWTNSEGYFVSHTTATHTLC